MSDVLIEFQISNPSDYERTDFVQLNLEEMGVPSNLDETTLAIYRLEGHFKDGKTYGNWYQVPYQIDHIMGKGGGLRILTILVEKALPSPSNIDDYSSVSAAYRLTIERPQSFFPEDELSRWHYYENPLPDEPEDGYSRIWYPERKARSVAFKNGGLEVHFSLSSRQASPSSFSHAGMVTAVKLKKAKVELGTEEVLDIAMDTDPTLPAMESEARAGSPR